MAAEIIEAIINGILVGGIYAIIAVGLTLIFGVMGIVNFAHGEFVMLGAYMILVLSNVLGINSYTALPLVAVGTYLIGIIIYRTLIIHVQDKEHSAQILLTIGLSYILISIAMLLFSTKHQLIDSPLSDSIVKINTMTFGLDWLVGFFSALAITLLVYYILHYRDIGKKIRAVAQNREAATLIGINVLSIYTIAFGIGAVAAGVGGALISNIYSFSPLIGKQFILVAFVIVVLGGLGSFWGAFIGGLIIGVSQSVASVFIPASLSPVVGYVIFIGVLWLHPQGLFGSKSRV